MERMDMAEKLMEKASVTIEEARDVLEKNGWDMLDAMVELEKQGKIHETEAVKASTAESQSASYEQVNPTLSGKVYNQDGSVAGDEENPKRRIKNAGRRVWRIMLDNQFVIRRKQEVILKVPVLLPVLCMMASFWTTVIVLFIGLVFSMRYSLESSKNGEAINQKVTDTVNQTMEKASEMTQNFVNGRSEKHRAE